MCQEIEEELSEEEYSASIIRSMESMIQSFKTTQAVLRIQGSDEKILSLEKSLLRLKKRAECRRNNCTN